MENLTWCLNNFKDAVSGYRKHEKVELHIHTKNGVKIHTAHVGCCREHGKENLGVKIEPAFKYMELTSTEFQCGFCGENKFSKVVK